MRADQAKKSVLQQAILEIQQEFYWDEAQRNWNPLKQPTNNDETLTRVFFIMRKHGLVPG